MKSKWSVGLSAFILLVVGVVPRGEQQTTTGATSCRGSANASRRRKPAGRTRRHRGRDCGRRGLLATAAGHPARPGRAAEAVPAPAGLQDRAGAHRPADRGSGRRHLRRQRPDVRARDALLHAGRRRIELARADQPHLAPRGHRRRRHVRQAHRVRRQDGHAAHRVSARRRRHPRARDRQPRHVQVHRHRR